MSDFNEPSLLDYLKSRLAFWRKSSIQLPSGEPAPVDAPPVEGRERSGLPPEENEENIEVPQPEPKPTLPAVRGPFPFLALVGLFLALIAQFTFEFPDRKPMPGVLLYAAAAVFAGIAFWRDEWAIAPLQEDERHHLGFSVRTAFWVGIPFALFTFFLFSGLKFTLFNILAWLAGLGLFVYGLAAPGGKKIFSWKAIQKTLRQPSWNVRLTRWTLLVLVIVGIVIFYRVYQIVQVPPEMTSDHAEKLLDVADVLSGQWSVFFPRNTGREFIQFYLTAWIITLFNTGLTYLSLKIGTILAGLLTLPYVYLLGKEVGNKRVALAAFFLAGIGYWPNVISRVGLRFPLYPLFVAPVLYYLIRGLRRANRNDFIWAGIFLGFGLNGYTPIRIMPFVVVIAVGLYLLHRQSRGARYEALFGLGIIALLSLVLFIPLYHYALEYPESFSFRAFSRLGIEGQPLPGPVWQLFLTNLWNALRMFAWSDGETWVHSIPFRPALDVVSAALFHLGVVLVGLRYLRKRNWADLFLILSIPLLMLPSILSLAFPNENPVLNRTAGAIVPVFVLCGIAYDGLLRGLENTRRPFFAKGVAWTVTLVLFLWTARSNYDLVFDQYYRGYQAFSWNTSEIGRVIHNFGEVTGETDSAWVVAYPYWVDTRLVGINAGAPERDFAIAPDQLAETLKEPRTKLFIVYQKDQDSLKNLIQLYPQGSQFFYRTIPDPNKSFYLFLVPAAGPINP